MMFIGVETNVLFSKAHIEHDWSIMEILVGALAALVVVAVTSAAFFWRRTQGTSVPEPVAADVDPPTLLPVNLPEPEVETDEDCSDGMGDELTDHVRYLDSGGATPEPEVLSGGPLLVPTCEQVRTLLRQLREAHERASARAEEAAWYGEAIAVGGRLIGDACKKDEQTRQARERLAEAWARDLQPLVASDESVATDAPAESSD